MRTLAQRLDQEPASELTRVMRVNLKQWAGLAARTRLELPTDGSPLSQQWERVRASLFQDASWFRRTSVDPLASVHPSPVASGPHAPAAGDQVLLEQALRELEGAVSSGERDIVNASTPTDADPFADPPGWAGTVQQWQDRLGEIQRALPPSPAFDINIYYREGLQDVTAAITPLKAITGGSGGSAQPTRRRYLNEARDHLAEARRSLTKAQ